MINRKVMYSTALSFSFLIIVAVVFISLVSIRSVSSFTFRNQTYNFTYVASNPSDWSSGLMNKTVTSNTFEIFVFPNVSIYPFWMKDTYYPLDIIWVNGSNVTYIANATPSAACDANSVNCTIYNNDTYGKAHPANYVIETLFGFTNRTGLKVGDKIKINYD